MRNLDLPMHKKRLLREALDYAKNFSFKGYYMDANDTTYLVWYDECSKINQDLVNEYLDESDGASLLCLVEKSINDIVDAKVSLESINCMIDKCRCLV